MTQNLTKYVNKTIMISIPALSGDVRCRPYKLTGVELVGLWLQSEDLATAFLGHERKAQAQAQAQATWAFFVPYSQIACVAVGTVAPTASTSGATPPAQVQASGPAPKQSVSDESASGDAATSQKKPKTTKK